MVVKGVGRHGDGLCRFVCCVLCACCVRCVQRKEEEDGKREERSGKMKIA